MAATNKYLARSNKSRTAAKATKNKNCETRSTNVDPTNERIISKAREGQHGRTLILSLLILPVGRRNFRNARCRDARRRFYAFRMAPETHCRGVRSTASDFTRTRSCTGMAMGWRIRLGCGISWSGLISFPPPLPGE